MNFIGKVLSQLKTPLYEEWVECFKDLEGTSEFPLTLALRSLEEVEESAEGVEEELRRCLLEDTIFNSISNYYYEDLIKAIAKNPDVSQELLENFSDRTEAIDEAIAKEATEHCAFIENENYCMGCDSCGSHKEFAELIAPWIRKDTDHFINSYLQAKTLHFALEQLIFDILPQQKESHIHISEKDIELFKHHVRSVVKRKLSTI